VLGICEQIDSGRLVCPKTHQPLHVEGLATLVSADGAHSYSFENGVPSLIADTQRQEEYRKQQDGAMHAEYSGRRARSISQRLAARIASIGAGHRSEASEAAFHAVVSDQPKEALCLSVGGGPTRVHENLVNVNVDLFENVDVVADAYALPYADGSVDAVHCEAVLEHLERPEAAVAEMWRVLRSGGEVFAATPFLQAFHAYPNHFQNFTMAGHSRLFERAGFELRSAGTCVGPTFALVDLTSVYLRSFVPTRLASRSLWALARLLFIPMSLLDRRIQRSPEAHVLASTVYAHLRKP
jgi:SAM-dependent methyltransferase